MSGRHSAAQATLLGPSRRLTAVAGARAPPLRCRRSASADYPQVRRIRPHGDLAGVRRRAGGVAEAMTMTRTVCTGGADNGDPVAVD